MGAMDYCATKTSSRSSQGYSSLKLTMAHTPRASSLPMSSNYVPHFVPFDASLTAH